MSTCVAGRDRSRPAWVTYSPTEGMSPQRHACYKAAETVPNVARTVDGCSVCSHDRRTLPMWAAASLSSGWAEVRFDLAVHPRSVPFGRGGFTHAVRMWQPPLFEVLPKRQAARKCAVPCPTSATNFASAD